MMPQLAGAAPHFVVTASPPDSLQLGDDGDSALGGSASPDPLAKSQCSSMSDGENYECYGEGVELELDRDSARKPQEGGGGAGPRSRSPSNMGLTRHTWLRTSLRRTSPNHQDNLPNRKWGSFRHSGGKRLGSNALASQLYRSSSFNSSGRSSNCDTAEDMYSDASLEEDVLDLNHKVQMLQQQVSALADNQSSTDDRYTRAKQDSAALQARVLMLEEQLREAELRAADRLEDEQKRHRELLARVEREKQLQIENCTIRMQALELEGASLREETARLRLQMDRLRCDKLLAEEKLVEADAKLAQLHDEARELREAERHAREDAARHRKADLQLVEEMSRELAHLKEIQHVVALPDDAGLQALQLQLDVLRQENTGLRDANEELQAQMLTHGLEQGRTLLTHSLAAEFEEMSQSEKNSAEQGVIVEMRGALREQQEVNSQLRAYIDGILLNIVENYPQLLEVKNPARPDS
ncbi:rab11 family-interacting protein 4A isoform X2 [Bacillus rossius redtenbacheri]|uniref:rab11 family-interacting protein 4A isoform X2 n=1 Tax=Bacillus rossius redtenbacheri TaxID=93214 RepID=UPI002FDE8219